MLTLFYVEEVDAFGRCVQIDFEWGQIEAAKALPSMEIQERPLDRCFRRALYPDVVG